VGDGCLYPFNSEGCNLETQQLIVLAHREVSIVRPRYLLLLQVCSPDQHDGWTGVQGTMITVRCFRLVVVRGKGHIGKSFCLFVCLFWCNSPQWARASSFKIFLDHRPRRTTLGRTALDE
jgi:hypothetical protein